MVVPSGQPGSASALSSVFTLLNSAIGAGVLSFPFAFRAAGWAGGLLATLAVAAVEGFTMYILARYAEFTGSATYSDLARKMLGRKAALLMSLVLLLYSYGSATAYLVILGDCFQPMLAEALGEAWWTGRSAVITGLGSLFMLPLCFPRTLDAISSFSSVTFFALLAVVGMVLKRASDALDSPGYDWGAVRAFQPPASFIDALPILCFGFQCHTNLAAVWAELEDEPALLLGSVTNLPALLASAGASPEAPSLPAAPKAGSGAADDGTDGSGAAEAAEAAAAPPPPQRVVVLQRPARRFMQPVHRTQKLLGMVHVLGTSLGLTAGFYVLVGGAGYLTFPVTARSNILLNYSDTDRLMQVARALVGVIQIIHYPVNHNPARNATRDLLAQLTGRAFTSTAFSVAETLWFFGFTLALSLAVSDLAQVFKLTGGLACAFFIFSFPGAFVLQYAVSKHWHVRGEGAEEALLQAADGAEAGGDGRPAGTAGAAAAAADGYHFLTSKLFWCGVVLQLMGIALLALTLYTLLAPPV